MSRENPLQHRRKHATAAPHQLAGRKSPRKPLGEKSGLVAGSNLMNQSHESPLASTNRYRFARVAATCNRQRSETSISSLTRCASCRCFHPGLRSRYLPAVRRPNVESHRSSGSFDLEGTTATSYLDPYLAKRHLVAIDALVGIADNEQIVLGPGHGRANQGVGSGADVLSFIHHHGTNAQLRLFLPDLLRDDQGLHVKDPSPWALHKPDAGVWRFPGNGNAAHRRAPSESDACCADSADH